MRILFLTPCLPFPPFQDGIRLRAHHLLKALAGLAEVHLLSLVDRQDLEEAKQTLAETRCHSLIVVPSSRVGSFAGRTSHIVTHKLLPYTVLNRPFVREVRNACRLHHPHVIHAELLLTAGYALACPQIPRVLDLIDSESLYLLKNSRRDGPHLSRTISAVRSRQIRRREKALLPRFSAITVSSPEDAAYLRHLVPGREPEVVSNGVDVDYFTPAAPEAEEEFTVGICGSFDYPPNVDAVRFFAQKVFGNLRDRFPGLRLLLIGRDPRGSLSDVRSMPGIAATGEVSDIRPELARCQVLVSSMRLGSGIKNTVLQAMSMARPVVATRQAVRAIEGIPGEHFLVGDSAEEILKAVADLLTQPLLRHELGARARQLVEQNYRWETRAARFLELYQHIQ